MAMEVVAADHGTDLLKPRLSPTNCPPATRHSFLPVRPRVLTLALFLMLGACGGGGGGHSNRAVVASALVVGQGQNQLEISARANSEIVLNGENSDGVTFPIRSAVWKQTDTTGIIVQLDKRSELSRAVRIPNVQQPVTLIFELTVTNTNDKRSVTTVRVNVVPVGDEDRFLEFFRRLPGQYTVVAALQSGTRTTSDVNFRIVQSERVDYPNSTAPVDSDLPNELNVPIRTPVTKSTFWPSGTVAEWQTAEEAVTAFYHPNLVFVLPKMDVDDINIKFDDTTPDRSIGKHHQDAVVHKLNLKLEVTGGTCVNARAEPINCADAAFLLVLRSDGTIAQTVTSSGNTERVVKVDDLAAPASGIDSQPESHATATAYYQAVDPFNRRLTFGNWLQNAGYTDASGRFIGRDQYEHTIYINNYDLGFTRSMYVRKDPNTGDVFTYVVNYPALRKAVLKEDDFATVAMEYGPPDQDPTAAKIVKFFVFAPDGKGNLQRVKSLNFDGRGEKWVPGACVPCHGGELKNLQPDGNYPANGNIHAAFLPWDIDSLLFVDARDPALIDPLTVEGFKLIPGYIGKEELRKFSLENQQTAFRRMNEIALGTMVESPGQSDRFSLVREQIHGWYGDFNQANFATDQLPPNSYNGRGYIQDGWAAAGLTDVYHDVFARHCRICHSQALEINQFRTLGALQDVRASVQRFVYEDGVMPNARLDMDRFWVDFRGSSTSAAQRFAAALQIPVASAEPPGRPIARIVGSKIQTALPRSVLVGRLDSIADIDVVNDDAVRLDGSISSFASTFVWQMLSVPTGSTTQIVGANTSNPAFRIDVPGTYQVRLTVNNARGPASSAAVTIDASRSGPKRVATAVQSVTLPEATPAQPSEVTIGSSALAWVDPDSPPASLTFTVTRAPTKGTLSLGSSFTQQQINSGQLSYIQSADSEGPDDAFTYMVEDDSGNRIINQNFSINITALNDEPTEESNGPLEVEEDETKSLQGALRWNDVDGVPEFQLVRLPVSGTLLRNGSAMSIGDTFDQAAVDADSIAYDHNNAQGVPNDSFAYTVGDGNTLIGPKDFPVSIKSRNNTPSLQTRTVSVGAGSSIKLSGALAAIVPADADLRVADLDTQIANIGFTLVNRPSVGTLVRRVNGIDTLIDTGNPFTLSDVTAVGNSNGIFYVSTQPRTSLSPVDDQLSLTVNDHPTTTGTCANPQAVQPACTLNFDITVRTDGPKNNGGVAAILNGFMDTARARDGSVRSPSVNLPWGDVPITEAAINFSDGKVTGDSGECDLKYRVASVPAGSEGVLKYGDSPLASTSDTRVITLGETFTDAELRARSIYYENRGIPTNPTGSSHLFGLVATDCLFEVPFNLLVERNRNFNTDFGFILDTIWSGADATYDTVRCPNIPNPTTERGCRNCHALTGGTDGNGGNQPGCAANVNPSNAFLPNSNPGNAPDCNKLKAKFGVAALPDRPTRTLTGGHSGGRIFDAETVPHQILKQGIASCPQ